MFLYVYCLLHFTHFGLTFLQRDVGTVISWRRSSLNLLCPHLTHLSGLTVLVLVSDALEQILNRALHSIQHLFLLSVLAALELNPIGHFVELVRDSPTDLRLVAWGRILDR